MIVCLIDVMSQAFFVKSYVILTCLRVSQFDIQKKAVNPEQSIKREIGVGNSLIHQPQ